MDTEDRTYAETQPIATGMALGRTFAGVYLGMVAGGMDEDDALAILSDYVVALASDTCTHGESG